MFYDVLIGAFAGAGGVGILHLLAELIARRVNRMQPVVPPPDAARDLSLGRSADRETLTKLLIVVDEELRAAHAECSHDHIQRLRLTSICNSILKRMLTRDLGPKPSESQDAMEKA